MEGRPAGQVRFHEALQVKPVALPDEAIGYRRGLQEVSQFVRQSPHPVHLADVARFLGMPDVSLASYHLRKATNAALIRKVSTYGGWVASR